jgi:hypothetical protein
MNKENAHLFLPLVQAFAEGKTIQYAGANWEDIEELVFSEYEQPKDFRIKPEPPRTFEMWLTPSGNMNIAEDKTVVRRGWKRITVQEVLK